MANVPVRTGHWVDHSHNPVFDSYLTLTVDGTNRLVAGTAVFVTFVAGSVWSIYSFILHQYHSTKPAKDVVDLQYRCLFRNVNSPQAAMSDVLSICLTWKNYGLHKRKGRSTRAASVCRRSFAVFMPALIIFGGFIAAGVFVANIASPQNQQTRVLVQSMQDLSNCGITSFNQSILANDKFDVKAAYDTRTAMSYSRSCYSTSPAVIDSVACSLFIKPKLNYTTERAECPFGQPTQSIEGTICAWNGNRAAYRVLTEKLDSHHDFGINAVPKDRLTLQKDTICSPISQNGFLSKYNGYGSQYNDSIISYNYGPAPNIQNATFLYNTASQYDNVPFQIYTLQHNATQLSSGWIPDPAIRRADADVTIVFIAPNSIRYRKRVIDPIFTSTYSNTGPSLTGVHYETFYADNKTSVLACTEQYQICTPNGICTPFTSLLPLQSNVTQLDLSTAQSVTAARLLYIVSSANLWSSINGLGAEALRMYSEVYDFISPGVPQNQWQLEVEGWVQTNLAKWQALMVEYAYNTADLSTSGHLDGPNTEDEPLRKEWQRQCREQMRANLAGYQNVSVLGLGLVYGIGGLVFLVSLVMQPLAFMLDGKWPVDQDVSTMSKHRARRMRWNIDGKYQAQRIALSTSGYTDLVGGSDDIPYLPTRSQVTLPFQENIAGGDTTYAVRQQSQITGSGTTASAAAGGRFKLSRLFASKKPTGTVQIVQTSPTAPPRATRPMMTPTTAPPTTTPPTTTPPAAAGRRP